MREHTISSDDADHRTALWTTTVIGAVTARPNMRRRAIALSVVLVSVLACGTPVAPTAPPAPTQSAASTPSGPASSQPILSTPSAPAIGQALWVHAGELGEARNATNVVVAGTGEVLVVGSDYETSWLSACGASTNGSDSVEIGDPISGIWTPATRLPSLRDAPIVVALADGRTLVTGGAAGENIGWSAYSSTYLFDPADRSWSRSGLLNTARTDAAATVLSDGRVLVAGGMYIDRADETAARILDSAELWDPASGSWSRTGPTARPRSKASAVTLTDGRVLLVGGWISNADQVPLAPTEVYDPRTGRWASAGDLAIPRSGFSLVALQDGSALVIGGVGAESHERLTRVERFDPGLNGWSLAEDLPYPVVGAAAVVLVDGRVLLAGGVVRDAEPIDDDGDPYVSGLTADALLFDPNSAHWTATTQMPGPRAGASAVLLPDGSALVVGGSGSEGGLFDTPGCPDADAQVFRYVPAS